MTDSEIYPLRRGYSGKAPPEVINAVRTVISDWDGTNWDAVRHCLEVTQPNANLDDWTMSDVRQRFAIAQRPITLKLGGRVNTTDATITLATTALVLPSAVTLHKPVDANPETSDESLVDAVQLGAFARVGGRVIRKALNNATCEPSIPSKGKGNPHQWRYCDAIQALRTVRTGKLRAVTWPDSAAELTAKKDSSKIPAKK